MADNRFKKMLASADFAIDPTNPAFKRTKGADTVMKEVTKLKRGAQDVPQPEVKFDKEARMASSVDTFNLDSMVKKMKQMPSKLWKKGNFRTESGT